ncbi:UNVERIFIED_CONTAM: hypothetical protein GTU68_014174, partial [Idotea baltica]|nr:hypothetical protein [Idotea baltica]
MSELPSVRQLECLVALDASLNFRLAAETCYITQPALSAQIQQLEALLGLQLFERDRRKVLPTPAGTAMSAKAREILGQLRDMAESASGFGDPLSGSIRMGVIPTVAPYVLPRALREVSRRHASLRIQLREEQTARLVELLECGELDVALLALEADIGDVQEVALFSDPFVLAVPKDHRLADRKRVSEKDLRGAEMLL